MTIAKKDDLLSADDALSVGDEDDLQQPAHNLQEHHRLPREADGWLRHGIFEVTPHTVARRDEVVPPARRDTGKRAPRKSDTPKLPLDAQVCALAYELFEQRGREHGHDVEDWLRAEQIILIRLHGGNAAA